jgi:hypothetical protein
MSCTDGKRGRIKKVGAESEEWGSNSVHTLIPVV